MPGPPGAKRGALVEINLESPFRSDMWESLLARFLRAHIQTMTEKRLRVYGIPNKTFSVTMTSESLAEAQAHTMAPFERNLPVLMGLLAVWYDFFGAQIVEGSMPMSNDHSDALVFYGVTGDL